MKLEKKVHGVNETNRIANLIYTDLIPQLKELVGEKIYLQSGGMSSKAKKAIKLLNVQPEIFSEGDYAKVHTLLLKCSYKSLWLELSCCFKESETGCFYQKQSIFVGELKDGLHLDSVKDDNIPLKYDYEAKEVRELFKVKEDLKKQISAIESEIYPFGGGYYD